MGLQPGVLAFTDTTLQEGDPGGAGPLGWHVRPPKPLPTVVAAAMALAVCRASDKCQREKRKTINGDDLLWAMTTLGFEDYIEPLKLYLQKFREVGRVGSAWAWPGVWAIDLKPRGVGWVLRVGGGEEAAGPGLVPCWAGHCAACVHACRCC